MTLASTVDAMVAASCSPEQIAAVVRAAEAAHAERRAKRAAQKRKERANVAATLSDIERHDATGGDIPPSPLPPSPPPRDNNSTPPLPPDPPSPTRELRSRARKAFDEGFWPFYPKRVGANPRHTAREKFAALVGNGEDPEAIIVGVKAYARTFPDGPSRYVKQTTAWLNQRCWEDEHVPPQSAGPPQLSVVGSMPQPGWNPTAGMFYAVRDSDQWVAWYEHRKATTGKGVSTDKHGGWYFPTEWPPKQEAAE